MRVMPYDPFRTLDQLTPSTRTPSSIPMDVVRHEDRIDLYFDLAGVTADDIELTVEKRELVVRAERSFAVEEDATLVRGERHHGTLTRRMLLAENLDTAGMQAEHRDGVLHVSIPVLAEAQPRRIPIG